MCVDQSESLILTTDQSQVPELPKEYGLQKLLMGGQGMEPPNDTSSVANMSVMTVTGTVFGPGNVGVREQVPATQRPSLYSN